MPQPHPRFATAPSARPSPFRTPFPFTLGLLASLLLLTSATPHAPASPVTTLAFSPDGTRLLNNGPRSIELRDPATAALLTRIPCDLPRIAALAFSPPSLPPLLAVAGGAPGAHGEVLLLRWPDATLLARIPAGSDLATAVAFHPTQPLLAIAGADHLTRWIPFHPDSAQPTEPALSLSGHTGPVLALAFSPSGNTLATASVDRSLKLWSTHPAKILRSFAYHTDAVLALAFRPMPHLSPPAPIPPVTCATAGDDRTLRIWQPEIGRMVRIVRGHSGAILALAYSPSGDALYSAGQEGLVRHIDPESDRILATRRVSADWIHSLAIHPKGSHLAAGDWSGQVHLLPLPLLPTDPDVPTPSPR